MDLGDQAVLKFVKLTESENTINFLLILFCFEQRATFKAIASAEKIEL